jgi:hypothetical protein
MLVDAACVDPKVLQSILQSLVSAEYKLIVTFFVSGRVVL